MVGVQGLSGAGQGVGLNLLPACLRSGSFVDARQGHGSVAQHLSRTVVRAEPSSLSSSVWTASHGSI